MAQTLAEHALSRICVYVSAMGVELTSDIVLKAVQLVEAGLKSGDKDLLTFVMARVPEHFALKHVDLPLATPEMCRGSIGYGKP